MSPASAFRWLASLTAVSAYLQISLGGVVRVSSSGLGCGDQWPPCRGALLPPPEVHAIIEYAHRVFGAATSILMLATAVAAWLVFRHRRPAVAWLATAALAVVALEIPLGALVVFKQLSAVLVLAHLAVALAILGLLTATAALPHTNPAGGAPATYRRQAWVAAGLTFAILLTGSTVVASGADEMCHSWPLCGGGLQPDLTGVNAFTMLHRLSAGVLGLVILYTLARGLRLGRGWGLPALRVAAGFTLVAFLAQVLVGAGAAINPGSQLFAALHVSMATAVWAGMVATACLGLPSPEPSRLETPNLKLESRPA
jgi:heme A synthase